MVIQRSAVTPQYGLSPNKQTHSALAHDLDARTVIALDEAREMPPGDERTEALHNAIVLRKAVEIHTLLSRDDATRGRTLGCERQLQVINLWRTSWK
jgi:hypothetical protein